MLLAVNSMRSQVLYPGLPPQEAPVLIAEKRKLFFSFLFFQVLYRAAQAWQQYAKLL